jgi:hypothetical protein
MGGLLEKAHRARGKEGDPLPEPGTSEISVQERIDLLTQIEDVVAKSRTPVTRETLAYTPRRSGLLFPLWVNIAAAAVIAGAALFFTLFFNRQEKTITGASGTAIAGESTLVSTVRREAEAALRNKDEQIGRIQGTLEQATKSLETLKAEGDARVQRKEGELRASFDARLAAERTRLQAQGGSAASVESQVAALRAQLQKNSDDSLAEFRRQVDRDTAQKQAAIAAQAADAQKSLAQARAEKAALQAQAEEAAASAQGEKARLATQLETLTTQGQQEQLVLDQISAFYAETGAAMNGGRFDDALGSLSTLAGYLDRPTVASLPAVQRRKAVDIFLIDALGKLAVSLKTGAKAGASLPAASPRQVQAISEAMAAGDELYAAGSYAAALDRYSAGLALLTDVPGMEKAAARIADAGHRQAMAELTARQDRAARPTLDRADALARKASYAEAIAAYAALVRTWPDSSYVNRSLTGIEGALGAQLKKRDDDAARREAARGAAAAEKIAAVTAGLSSTSRAADASVAAAQRELITLLDAKVKVKTILVSDEVKGQYPGLADALERYLQLYGEQKGIAGRIMALQDVATVLDFLQGARGKEAMAPLVSRYADQGERTAFQQILERLRGLPPAP